VGVAFAAALAQDPFPDQTVFVIPVLNISGYNANERREEAKGTTFDPNRDYPGPCGTEGPFNLKSTAALAQFVEANHIVASATMHTFAPAVLYPWGFDTPDLGNPYPDIFLQLTKAATVVSQYPVGNSAELIYPANGTFEDYAFWKDGIWSLLFEIGDSHTPNQTDVQELIRVNVPGLHQMMATAPKVPAANHAFTGRCNTRLERFDRHNE
jgi:hypothetical protein